MSYVEFCSKSGPFILRSFSLLNSSFRVNPVRCLSRGPSWGIGMVGGRLGWRDGAPWKINPTMCLISNSDTYVTLLYQLLRTRHSTMPVASRSCRTHLFNRTMSSGFWRSMESGLAATVFPLCAKRTVPLKPLQSSHISRPQSKSFSVVFLIIQSWNLQMMVGGMSSSAHSIKWISAPPCLIPT